VKMFPRKADNIALEAVLRNVKSLSGRVTALP